MRSGCGEYYFKLTAHKEGFWDMAILEIFGFSYFVFHILMQLGISIHVDKNVIVIYIFMHGRLLLFTALCSMDAYRWLCDGR